MPKLTTRYLETLKHSATGKVFSKSDKGLKLVLSQKPSTLKSWQLTYYIDGRKLRYQFGRYSSTDTPDQGAYSLAQATRERDRLKDLVKIGIDPREIVAQEIRERQMDRLSRVTMAELRQRFETDYLQRKNRKSSGEIIRTLSTKFREWDQYEVKNVNKLMITSRLDEIGRTAPVMRNRAHSYLRSMLSFAVEKSIVEVNHAKEISQESEKAKTRKLSADEIRYFWHEIDNQPLKPATRIALKLILTTGQRGGEVLSIERNHISDQWWTQSTSKNGRAHRTYLTPTAITLLDEAASLSDSDTYLFPSRQSHVQTSTLSKAIRRWVDNDESPMQIPAFSPHDLRRSMSSALGNMEISRFAQNQILNHKDNTIGRVYDLNEYDALKQRVMTRWEARLTAIINNQQNETDSADNVVSLHG